jgi:type III secretion protein D
VTDTPVPQVLRVLNGRLAGTEKALPPSGTLSIGYQFWQDVVIRDPATKGIACDLRIDESGAAQILVLSGEARLLGSPLVAGQTGLLPPYVPVSIGGVALAWGDPASARWQEAGGLAASVPQLPPPPPTMGDQARDFLAETGDRLAELFSGKRALVAVGAGLLLVGASAAGPAVDALGLRGNPSVRAEHALNQAGLPGLNAAPDPGADGVVVTGVVSNEQDRVKAQQVLRTAYVPGTVQVQTSQELAQASADVARIHGHDAVARPIGRTDVELRTTPLSDDDRTRLLHAVKADVPAVGQIAIKDDLAPDDMPLKSVQDATKKVSTVVAGDPSYISTSDGAHYFPGAMMPSGHKLVGIEGNVVLLEKNGRETRLTF